MSILTVLYSLLFTDIWTAVITILIGFVTYKISKLYYKVYTLPPGPFPLPLVGNILLFRTKEHWDSVLQQINKKYGPVFTFWMGNNPFVFVTDIDIAREAFRKNDFAGRTESYFGSFLSNDKYKDVVFTDYGHTWEALRRVTHSAAQKYARNDKLVVVATDTVDNVVKLMISREGLNKEFNPINYIYLTFLNILATSAFGRKFELDDDDFKKLRYFLKGFNEEVGSRLLLWEFSSLIRLFDRKMILKHKILIEDVVDMNFQYFKSHLKDYDPSIERDFCDALITAKNEALKDGKESAPYLTDANLAMAVFDLFIAGTDTSQQTFQWILLFMTYYSDVQKKLRQEIESEIGDRIPTHEDRNRCHYVMAFISEILRMRNAAGSGLPHKAIVNSKIGEHTIPEGNGIFVYHGIILMDEKHFPNPQEFKPERFIENGKFMTTRHKAYIPFGVGRRVCLGEKLAIADLFLVLVRFIQLTSDYDLVLGTNGGLEADPNITENYSPKEYKIIFKKK